jgi:peptidoglycan-N-acetylglucosamine deacetylase
VIRHALAPVRPSSACALALPRSLIGVGGVILTFDDGPHPEGTTAVLAVLARTGARATFFVVGEQVQRRPALVAEIAAAGHEVALHDIRRGVATVEDAIGTTPLWHRPPYGIYSGAGLSAARAAGLRPLLWSRWGKDWRRFTTPRRIAGRVLTGILPGDVILLHDADFYSAGNSHRRTVAALELVTAELQRRKLATVLPV